MLEILHSRKIDRILACDNSSLPENLLEGLTSNGIRVNIPTSDSLVADSLVQAGLTGSFAGVADTGSLVILSGAGQPLLTSLLPELHIAIVWEKDIVDTLAEVLVRDEVRKASAAIVVTGPSRTADIEMTLTIGVHGPGELFVFCIR